MVAVGQAHRRVCPRPSARRAGTEIDAEPSISVARGQSRCHRPDHIVWGQVNDLHTLADQIRAENDGVWGYAAGDVLLNISMKAFEAAAFVGAWQAAGLPTAQLGISTSGHVGYGVTMGGRTTLFHFVGPWGAMQNIGMGAGYASEMVWISGVPVLFPGAVIGWDAVSGTCARSVQLFRVCVPAWNSGA
jgi:hypothetical protein